MKSAAWPLESKIAASRIVAAIALLAITAAQCQVTIATVKAGSSVDHTRQVIESLTGAVSGAIQAQNAVRGYLLTNDVAVLGPSEAAIAQLRENLRHAGELTADNARQQTRLHALEPIILLIVAIQDRAARERNLPDYSPARVAALVESGTGQVTDLQRSVEEMLYEENRLLEVRMARSKQFSPFAIPLLGLGAVTMLIALAASNGQIRKLGQSERRFRQVLEAAPDAMVVIDEKGKMVLVNARMEKLFGYRREELVGREIEMLMPERFRAEHPGRRQGFFGGAQARQMGAGLDLYGRRGDGGEFPIEINLGPFETGEGPLVSGAIRDISEHKRVEEQLRTQALRLQEQASLLDVAHDAIIVREFGGKITFWNSGAESLYGWSKAEAIGKISHTLLQTEYPHPMAEVEAAVQRDGRWEGELTQARRDGSRLVVASRKVVHHDDHGSAVGILEINTDISAARQAEERFRHLLESATDAIVVMNREGKIVLVNARVERLFGYRRDELLGQKIDMLIPERLRRPHLAHGDSFLTEPRPRAMAAAAELYGVRRDGVEFPVEISLSPLETAEGALVSAAIRDISEHKRIEEQLNAQVARLQEQASLLDVAHDAIIARDFGGKITFWNLGAESIYGWKKTEAVGQIAHTLLRTEYPQPRAEIEAIIQREGKWHGELKQFRSDGSRVLVDSRKVLQENSNGEAVGVFEINTDISVARRAEERFQQLLETAPDAIVVLNSDARIILVNQQVERFFGYRREELLGQHLEVLMPERLRQEYPGRRDSFFSDLHQHSMGAGLESYGLRRDGSEFPIEISLSPLETSEGTLVSGVIRDITKHKRNEKELKAQAATLREQASLLDVTHDAIISRTLDGEIRFWSRGAELMFGWSSAEAIGKITHALLQTQFPQPLAELEQALMGGGRWAGELIQTRRDGSRVTVSCRKILQRDGKGNARGILEISMDVSARRQAEERFRQLMEGAPDAIVVVNQEGRIVLVNARVEQLFGYRRDQLLDQKLEMLIPERFRHRHLEHRGFFFTQPLLRPMGAGLELFGLRADGVEFPVEISLSPLDTPDGWLVSSTIRDITQRKRAEEEIKNLNRGLVERYAELASANKELEAFTYSIAHDLRAPVRHIEGFSKILTQELGAGTSPAVRECLSDIVESTQNMGRMVDDLLALARVGRQELNIEVTGLSSLVGEVLKELSLDVPDRDIQWQIGELPYIDCDPGLLKQVFANLLSNAVKYSRPRRQAVIAVGQLKGSGPPTIFIRDNGVGFNMKYADKLFGVFQRLHRKEDFEGTGVGLATVQRIVHKHGGAIWAESELDKGATFFFNLAASSAAEELNGKKDE